MYQRRFSFDDSPSDRSPRSPFSRGDDDDAATAHEVEVDAEFTLDLAEAATEEALEP